MTKENYYETNANTMIEFLEVALKEVDLVRKNHKSGLTFNDYGFYLNGLTTHMDEDYSYPIRDRLKTIYDAFEVIKFEQDMGKIERISGSEEEESTWEEFDPGDFEKSAIYKTVVEMLYFNIDGAINKYRFLEKGRQIFLS